MAATLVSWCLLAVCPADQPASRVASAVKGIVVDVAVKKGDKVTAAQLLIRLDDRQARLAVDLAKLNIAAAEAEHEAERAALQEVEARHERKKVLQVNNAISADEFRASQLLLEKYRSETKHRAIQVDIAKLNLTRARLYLEQHEIRAPAAGIVHEVLLNVGEGVVEMQSVVSVRRN